MTETFDTSTLDWVDSELRCVIDRVRDSLDSFAADSKDFTPLRVAGTQLRHVAGTLAMTELAASASLAEETERTLSYCVDKSDDRRASALQSLFSRALDSLAGRIDAVRKTGLDEAVSTIALVNELRVGRKSEMIDLATVFHPDLYVALPSAVEDQPVETVDTSVERRQFQECLLAWVNDSGDNAQLSAMAGVFARLRAGAGAESWRRLWWVAEAFALTREFKSSISDRSSIALFRRLDQHIRRFDEAGSAGAIDEDLILHLLFGIAQVDEQNDCAVANEVIKTFALRAEHHRDTAAASDVLPTGTVSAESEVVVGAATERSERRASLDVQGGAAVLTREPRAHSEPDTDVLAAPVVTVGEEDGVGSLDVDEAGRPDSPSLFDDSIETTANDDADFALALPVNDPSHQSDTVLDNGQSVAIDEVRAAQADVRAAVRDHSLKAGNEDGLLFVCERLDQIVAQLDAAGHTNASDVIDLCRRSLDASTIGGASSVERVAENVDAGINAVVRHLAASAGEGELDSDSLSVAHKALTTGLAESRVAVIPLPTMRRNLADYFDDWRRPDATRHDWRNLRVSIDDIAAFAERNENDGLRQAALSLSTILSNLIARLSKPDPSDIAQLDKAMERILIELADAIDNPTEKRDSEDDSAANSQKDVESRANDDRGTTGARGRIGNVGASNDIVGVVGSRVRSFKADAGSTSPSSSFVGERTALLKVLRQIQERLPELIADPKSKELQHELPLGLLLVKEKAERNGLGAVAEIARIGEKLLHDVANGVVNMSPAVAQFVSFACDRIEALVHVEPPTVAQANVEAWRLGAASARQGRDPSPVLGEEAIAQVDSPSAESTPTTTAESDKTANESKSVDSAPAGSTVFESGSPGKKLPPSKASTQSARSSAPGSKSPTATTAGSLVQQVLANSGMAAELDAGNVRAKSTENVESETGAAEAGEEPVANTASSSAARFFAEHDGLLTTNPEPETEPASVTDDKSSVEQLIAPVTDAAPSKEALKAEPQFEAAADRVSKLSAPHQPNTDHAQSVAEPVADTADDDVNPVDEVAETAVAHTAPTTSGPVTEENIEVLVGEAMAHTASIGQWIEQVDSSAQSRAVDDDIASTVNVLRTITRVIGDHAIADVFESLHETLDLTRGSAMSLTDAQLLFIKRTRRLTDSALQSLADGKSVPHAQRNKLDALAGEIKAYVLQERSIQSADEAGDNEQIPIKIVGDDIVTLEQLAGGRSSDQLDLDRLFIEESSDIFRRINEATMRWRDENFARHARSDLLHEFHTLKGNARTACFPEASALAHSLETLVGQQSQPANGSGLHGEEVVIYLNKAATVLADFIQHPDSEETRRAVESLKRQVDAQCVTEARPDGAAEQTAAGEPRNATTKADAPSDRDDDDAGTSTAVDTEIPSVVASNPIGQMRDLATVAATTYAYEGFQKSRREDAGPLLDGAVPGDDDNDVRPRRESSGRMQNTSPPVVVEVADERTLPSSLMAPAMLITESEIALSGRSNLESVIANNHGALERTAIDRAVSGPGHHAELIETAAEKMALLRHMSTTLGADLTALLAVRDRMESGVVRVQDRVRELGTARSVTVPADNDIGSQFDEIRIELAALRRGLRKFADRATDTRDLFARHSDSLSTLTRELDGLRKVRFDSVASRLRLVVRQSAAEMNKETRFVLRGGDIDIDRYVLDCVLGPIENLLRNAVVHGIENAAERTKARKATAGTVQLSLDQSDEHLVIEVSDDGAGVDYPALAACIEASERQNDGGATRGDESDATRSRLIERMFDVGISTASKPTELAGRGVGLDVVRKVARLLSGRVDVTSDVGQGSRFKIRLPAMAESTAARIISMDDCAVALPAHSIQSVHEIPETNLAAMLTADADYVYLDGRRFPYLDLNLELGLSWSPADTTTALTNLFVVPLTRADIVVKASGSSEAAIVVRHSDPAEDREVALVPATFTAVEWLNIDALWTSRSRSETAVGVAGDAGEAGKQPAFDLKAGGSERPDSIDDAASRQSTRTERGDATTGLNILIVADKRDVASALLTELRTKNAQTHISSSSVEALRQLDNGPVSAIVVDLDLPGGEAFELLDHLRKREASKRPITIVVSSAANDPFQLQRLDTLGVEHVVHKPCDNDVLASLILDSVESVD